jgi:Putative beta-barrel porin-2, OmpL-like. bbp2
MKFEYLKSLGAIVICFGLVSVCAAQDAPAPAAPAAQSASAPAAPADAAAPAAPAAPMALSTPSVTGPLSNLPPAIFDAGPFGKLAVNGLISGMAVGQSNHVPGDNIFQPAISNAQVFIQKTDGWFQFYVQAGAYNIPSLGVPFLSTQKTITDTFSPVPVAFVKLQAGKNTSFEIGSLPTLIGAEYTFTFENMNVQRGLLWNQENLINRGIQVNQTLGKFALSASWNDGFYSNRYTWVTGSVAYTNGAHALSFVAGGNAGQTKFQTYATPVQNNGSIYNVIYTFTKGPWILQPYYQYTTVPTNVNIGVENGAHTNGGAILASHAFSHGFSLAGRFEYISSNGTAALDTVNLLYGPGSSATSFTATPTFQYGGFFFRTDLAITHANSFTSGDVFGPKGANDNQFRAAAEMGFIFGNNIVAEKKP